MSDRATTKMLMERLERHYIKPGPMPGGVFVPECGLNGSSQSRADALYIGFTSTSGRLLVGHEVKASRADWRKELDTAGKADLWADNCHEWWIVAPGPDVVPKEEVPHGWGLMYPSARSKTRMDKVLRATTHADRQPSWQIMRSVLARLDTLRAAHDQAVIQQAVDKAREEQRRMQETAARFGSGEGMTDEVRRRLEALTRIEKALGVEDITDWRWHADRDLTQIDAATAAAALKLVDLMANAGLEQQVYVTERLRIVAQNMTKSLDEFEEARGALVALGGRDS